MSDPTYGRRDPVYDPGDPPVSDGSPHECPACHAENDLPPEHDGIGECYNCGFDGEMIAL